MFNRKSSYALNKKDPNAIVYMDANEAIIRLTREDFASEEEFLKWKSLSDADYHASEKEDHVYANHTLALDELSEEAASIPAADICMEQAHDRVAEIRRSTQKVTQIRKHLTDTQFRRMWMYFVDGMTIDEIGKVDPYAARVVCDIFRMRLEGASASKIASELNRLGILSPLAYKKNNGLPYAKKGYADKADCKWSATTIIRILQDETYTGTLVQGKQGTPHYKIKQMEQRPASEWVRVPDAHKALIARQDFELVQRIKGLDTRTSPNEDTVYLFSGILICGCCGSRMTRKTNRANGKEYHYYYCPTGKKKGCAHPVMLKESSLIDCVRDSLKAYIGNIASLEALLTGIDQTSINQALAKEYSDHITDNERRLEQVLEFKARLYESLVGGMLTKEEYASYKAKYTKQAEDIRESVRVLKEKLTEVLENRSERNRWISQFTQFSTLETLDRRALIHMVQSIRVRGKKELDITFTHEDEYKKALQLLALAAQQKDYEQRKVG